jgi:hypothetical protein
MNDGLLAENAAYQLRRILAAEGAELAVGQPWLWEFDRWKELVFALLARLTSVPEAGLRLLVDRLADLDLLGVDALGVDGDGEPMATRITDLMVDAGLSADEAARALTTVVEAARGLRRTSGGKVQRYLRRYGELMLREVPDYFDFTALPSDEVQDAFTYWLQNAVNLPLSLVDDSLRAFCGHYGFTPADLIEGADRIDLNLAVADDAVQLHVLAHEEAWSANDKGPPAGQEPGEPASTDADELVATSPRDDESRVDRDVG